MLVNRRTKFCTQLPKPFQLSGKEEELAHRGIRLAFLLDFWEELLEGTLMPSFDAERSLTNDVVRLAIIPRSRVGRGGKALASIWENSVLPRNMVTHNWTNRFACLVGGIVADALNEGTYEELAEQLNSEEGVEKLRNRLLECGKMDVTYWVCAFSVNQHASICGGYGPEPPEDTPEWQAWDQKRYDSVSLQKFPLCRCSQPKILSHANPACELNKFDDMMRYLDRRVLLFSHVIIVDQQFELLRRAWCVAEIVEGNVLGTCPQLGSSLKQVGRDYLQ